MSTWNILESALLHLGIGGKTSSGYGRMILEKIPVDQDIQRANELIKKIQALSRTSFAGIISQYAKELLESQMKIVQKQRVAKVIIDEVKKYNREKAEADKNWYTDVLEILLLHK